MCEGDEQQFAERVLKAEADAIRSVKVGEGFSEAASLLVQATGRLVVSGLGKSGLIGQKLSATFASTGTPSHFLHPVEALHGDLGRVKAEDVVLALSYSGQTEELVTLAELLKPDGVPVIALVSSAETDLGRAARVVVPVGDVSEACPHNLAPTASTAAMLALGDALALSVARRRGFSADDFHRLHPGGGLGRQLMPVVEAMRFRAGENLPLIRQGATVSDAYGQAQSEAASANLRRPGALLVIDEAGKLAGMVTDGDLRTALIERGPSVWQSPIDQIMTTSPTTLPDDAVVRDAVHVVRSRRFDEVPVVDGLGYPLGLIDVQDLAALRVIDG